jgi:hypothetical protein
MPSHPSASRDSGWLRDGLAALGITLCIAFARALYVSLYSAEIPFWDQWDELYRLLAPWQDGSWQHSALFAPHNEHRILFTRLFSMLLMTLDGGIWSNLVEAYANALFYAGTLALFYVLACRGATDRATRWILLCATIALGSLPFDWENSLVGFQNQFYVMCGFAIAMVGVASFRAPSRSTFWLLCVLATASLFTMASGLLAATAVIAVVALRCRREPMRPAYVMAVIAAMALVMAWGLLLLPDISGTSQFKAQGMVDHARAFMTVLIWPLQPLALKQSLFVFVLWSPSLVWLGRFLLLRRATDREIFAGGIAAWVLLQAMAIAHTRGHGMTILPSRYMGITAIGLLANLALAMHLLCEVKPRSVPRRFGMACVATGIVLITVVFIKRTPGDMAAMQQRHDFSLIETHYTRNYLSSGNPGFLQHPLLTIPYPDATQLRLFLDTTSLRALLPPSLTTGAADASPPHGSLVTLSTDLQRVVQERFASFGVTTDGIIFGDLPAETPTATLANQPIGACALDLVNPAAVDHAVHAKSGDPIQFEGWLINPAAPVSTTFVMQLTGNDRYGLEIRPRGIRRDIARVMHSRRSDTFGFATLAVLAGVKPGKYAVLLTTPGVDAREICGLPVQLIIDP